MKIKTEELKHIFRISPLTLILVSIFLTTIIIISLVTLDKMEDQTRLETISVLQNFLKISNEAIHLWANDYKKNISLTVSSPALLEFTKAQLAVPRHKDALISSPTLSKIREHFRLELEITGELGIFIISPDYISIASMRDENVGSMNPIAREHKELLDRVFNGIIQIIPSIKSDVPLQNLSGKYVDSYPTMFVAAPVKDESGKVIAVFTKRIDVSLDFNRVAGISHIGKTGETYLFDKHGTLLTDSRFDEQLKNIGLLKSDEYSALTISIRDPGGNMVKGFIPKIPRHEQPLTYMARQAIDGKAGMNLKEYRNYRGVPVLGAWLWDDELIFGMATEIDLEEALKSYYVTRNTTLGGLSLTVFLLLILYAVLIGIRKQAALKLKASEEKLRAQYKGIPVPTYTYQKIGEDFVLIDYNDAAFEFTDGNIVKLLGKKAGEIYKDTPLILEDFSECFSRKTSLGREIIHQLKSTEKIKEVSFKYAFVPPDLVMVHAEDISDRKEAEENIHLLQSITVAVNETEDFHSALEITLEMVCKTIGWDYSESWIPNSDATRLEIGPICYNSSVDKLKNFERASQKFIFSLNSGLPGKIFSSQKSLWVKDISKESKNIFPRAKNAMKAGLKTGFGVPLIADDKVLAVFIFFNSKSYKEDKRKVEIVAAVVAQLGSVVQRKKAERALLKSEEKYRDLFETSRDAIYMTTRDGTFEDGNESLFQLTGYTVEELQEINLKRLYITHEDWDKFQKEIEKTGYITDYELKIKKKDGTILQCLETATLRHDENGKVVGYQGILRDVTQIRKRLEQIQKLSYAIEQSASSVVITDINGKIEYVNPKFVENTGYSEEELLSQNPRMMKSGEHGKDFYKELWDTIKSGNEWKGELRDKKKNGDLHWNLTRISPIIDNKGIITHFVSVHEDVTEQKNFEEEKRNLKVKVERAERMESMGIMAGGVAHDLNNILGPILGYPDLIMDYLPENSPARDDLHLIKESAMSASELVGDLLTLARRGRYQMETLNLNDIIRRNLDSPGMIREKTLNPKVKLEILLDEDIHNIEGSTPHLSKVIMNLLINAYEALPSGGHVKVRSFNTTIDDTIISFGEIKEGKYAVIEMEDDGIGMDKEDQKKIFEPFYTKKKMGKSGTGLGLAIVWGVIKDHGGYIEVKSEIGIGTKFTLYFPASDKDIETAVEISSDLRGSETILVVDDNKKQRALACRLLTSLGYEVKQVSSGRKAVNFIKKEKVDIVLLDMILGDGLDGLDTYKEIIKINSGQKAIIVSGFSETDQVRETIKLGAGGYIKKPYSVHDIGKAVREELDKEERIL